MTMNISTSGGLTRVFSIFILSTFLPFLKISENNIKPLWTYLKYSFSCHRVWGDTQDIIKRNPANIRLGKDVLKTSSRRLQDVFSVTFFCLPRRLEDIIARRLANTSWRHNCKTPCKHVLKTSWRRFRKTYCQCVLKDEKCYAEDVFKTSWKARNVCWEAIYHP